MMGKNVCLPHRVHIILVSFMIKTNSVTTSIWTDSLPDPFPPHRLTASTATVWAMSIVDYLIHHQHIVASVLRCRSGRRNPEFVGVLRKIRKSHFQKKESSKLFNFYISHAFVGSCVAKSCFSQQPSIEHHLSNHRIIDPNVWIWYDLIGFAGANLLQRPNHV